MNSSIEELAKLIKGPLTWDHKATGNANLKRLQAGEIFHNGKWITKKDKNNKKNK